ncbi:hypothetical protein GCM10011351_29310 [Paraliobacillus quinghaiensis]|uniref:Uncharacterized protein n=1 Tax=Paraliobacillus quinghaiensis TaxID=470815 RepID=A0A917WYH9_9BACI|nr:hypothetical protein [Paraliobacillus quinghaiensis]GGM41260.1 hypothetical protein GCM10011351_29310 [Paraliobacillus quinghaiensis]
MGKVIQYVIVVILGLTIINAISAINDVVTSNGSIMLGQDTDWNYFYMTLLSILLGVLIEWKRLLKIITGNLKLNWLIVPSVILLIISLIPMSLIVEQLGFVSYHNFLQGILFAPLQDINTILILGILSGILLIRSLIKDIE